MVQTEIEKLQETIAALEAQRHSLGDHVVDSALAPLREKLAALQGDLVGEQRKKVTVLFADLAGFTALSARLDPEDVRELLNTYFAGWNASIKGFGGAVEKFIGDAVMAVFGLAHAHEDDPERAIRAALEMRGKLDELNVEIEHKYGFVLRTRVGICTGEVVVGLLGERLKDEFVVVGDTVNLASRLQEAAPEGGILIDQATHRLVRRIFDVLKLEPIRTKGLESPLQVYLVQGPKPRAFKIEPPSVEGVETRLIGRDMELKRLKNAFSRTVESGQFQVFTVVGEAGIGKSRLIYELDDWLESLDDRVVHFEGRAYPLMQNSSYSLLRSLFSFRFQIHDSDAPQVVWEKLVRGVSVDLEQNEPENRKVYFIGRLLGFELGDDHAWQANIGDARRFQEQALGYLLDYFRLTAQKSPVVILLEDIHWADNSSLDLIRRMSSSLVDQPLLVVCSARKELFVRLPEWGEDLTFHERLELQPLTVEESQDLMAEILQEVASVPSELRELVVGRAEGNPFFIEEGIKMLIDEGVIEKSSGRWRAHPRRLTEVKIPPTLEGLLQARLDSLVPRQRALLQRGSVLGRVFWDQAVEFIGKKENGGHTSDEVPIQSTLGDLLHREIIFLQEQSTFEGTDEFLFKHALFRDVTYESLLRRTRRLYHARAARWLEQMSKNTLRTDENATLIAQHYEQAGDGVPAAKWYRRAGVLAASRYANIEAVHAFSRALQLTPESEIPDLFEITLAREQVLDRLGDRESQRADLDQLVKLAEAIGDAATRSEVELRRANFGFATGDYSTGISAAQQAIQLAQVAGSVENEARGYYLWGRSLDFQQAGPESLEKFEKALELARAARLPRLEADTLMSLGPHFSDLNDYEESRKHLTAALRIYRQMNDRQGEGKALGNLGVAYWGQGNYVEAQSHFEAALSAVQEVGDRMVEGILVGNLGVLAHERLDYGASLRYHSQALDISREVNDRHSEAISLGNLAEAARDLGDFNQARLAYEQALKIAQEVGVTQIQSGIQLSFSLLLEYLGEDQAALESAQQALVLAKDVKNQVFESGSLSRLAQALLTLNRYREAAEHFQQALDLQERLGLENRAIESRAGLASVKLAQGDIPSALGYVEEVLHHLQTKNLTNTEEPVRVFLTCFQVLQAERDPRALAVLEAGYRFLLELQSTVDDPDLRSSFLNVVPTNRLVLELWREFHG